MPGCSARVEWQGGTADTNVGSFWFRDRSHCSRASGLKISFGSLLSGTAGSNSAVYSVAVGANCCPGGTEFTVSGTTFTISGPGGQTYTLAYDASNRVVLAGSNATPQPTDFNTTNFNAMTSAYIEAIPGCPNALRLRTVGV